ncbi:MAG: hypothetical protein F6J87_09090 [Spirulina sp. SIO3F2]|nr:hypothetical protein [Spirulina sp. SIO3F2]
MSQECDYQLIDAFEAQDLEAFKAALAAGANPNLIVMTVEGERSLFQVAKRYSLPLMKHALIEAGAEISDLHDELRAVINEEALHLVPLLLAKGADVNATDISPLYDAVVTGDTSLIQLLLEAGADPNLRAGHAKPLFRAIEESQPEIALQFLAAGANPNAENHPYNIPTPPIAFATAYGETQIVQALLAAGADANVEVKVIELDSGRTTQQGADALHTINAAYEALAKATESGDETGVKKALDCITQTKGLEPIPLFYKTSVLIAAQFGRAAELTLLLDAGADPLRKDAEGFSAYDWAVQNNDQTMLAVLAQFGIDTPHVSSEERLLNAAEVGDLERVKQALAQKADLNARDFRKTTKNKTPLMLAAMNGHVAIVEHLLQIGADPNLSDVIEPMPEWVKERRLDHIEEIGYQLGRTSLMLAAIENHLTIVKVLIKGGADICLMDELGYTALILASERGHLAIVQYLLDQGADIEQKDRSGSTPVMIAIHRDHQELAQFLLDAGADIHGKNQVGYTCLIYAALNCNLPLVQQLLAQQAEVNVLISYSRTPLICAARADRCVQFERGSEPAAARRVEYRKEGNTAWIALPDSQILPIVDALLNAGADPNLANEEGETALMQVVYDASLPVIKRFLDAGVRLDVRDQEGRTALGSAKLYGRQDVLELLREYAGDRAAELEQDIELPEEESE